MNIKKRSFDLPTALRTSFEKYSNRAALGFAGEQVITYKELKEQVETLAAKLQSIGIGSGSKIAILSSNMPNWAVSYFAIAYTGAIVVPILPDFSNKEVTNILEHSETEAVFTSSLLISKIDTDVLPKLKVFSIENFEEITKNGSVSISDATASDYQKVVIDENQLLSIIYTSGTTGVSKGVMLSHKNILWTAYQCRHLQPIDENDRFLSILPLSHTFENTLGLIYPTLYGSSMHYLRKAPTAAALLPALKQVQPTLMFSVPLIIEKIYRGKILKEINNSVITKSLYRFRPTRIILSRIIGKKLAKTFGGKLKFFGVGGSKLDNECERFLMDAKFPLAIGYGLTETSPLLAGGVKGNLRYLSTGATFSGVKLRIANADPISGEGEIQAKGENIMQGYYKNDDLTKQSFTEDGWFKTGDLGKFEKGSLFIKGRIKNMILGASGENIYPEEIESLINRKDYVLESLVLEQKGKLIAMVHLNIEELEERYIQFKGSLHEKVDEILREIQKSINEDVNKFSRLQTVMLQPIPFEKTPTMKIKRFLYS
ncbi:MAG: AMP-binding protein [Bacteroidales bacterium]